MAGEFVARLVAVDAARAANGGELPCGVTFVVEGEEEIGSPHIARGAVPSMPLPAPRHTRRYGGHRVHRVRAPTRPMSMRVSIISSTVLVRLPAS